MSATQPRVRVPLDLPAIKRKIWRDRIRKYEYLSREATTYTAIDAAAPYIAAEARAALLASLETLRDQWRTEAEDRLREAAKSDDPDAHDGFISGMTVAADDLHRVIEGARG